MARVKTVAGYPVEQYDSPNKGGTMTGHRGIVLHIAQGTYRGTISWQQNPDQRYADGTQVTTSSTWIVGREPGEIAQMVDSDLIAWCQRSGSRDWLSVELAGYAPNPPTAWQIEACAHLLVWVHRTYGIPIQATSDTSGHGLGHHSMDNDTTVQWGHDACPGTGVIAAKDDIVRRAQALLTGEDDMATVEEIWGAQSGTGDERKSALQLVREGRNGAVAAAAGVTALRAVVEQLAAAITAGGGTVDTAAILAGVDQRLAAVRADMRDAVGDLGEGGAAKVRAPQS